MPSLSDKQVRRKVYGSRGGGGGGAGGGGGGVGSTPSGAAVNDDEPSDAELTNEEKLSAEIILNFSGIYFYFCHMKIAIIYCFSHTIISWQIYLHFYTTDISIF